eukprot:1174027-Pleurochrysis_carterae.AAC.1
MAPVATSLTGSAVAGLAVTSRTMGSAAPSASLSSVEVMAAHTMESESGTSAPSSTAVRVRESVARCVLRRSCASCAASSDTGRAIRA